MKFGGLFKRFLSTKWRIIVSLVILIALSVTVKVANPLIIRHIIDNIVLAGTIDTPRLVFWTISMGLITILGFVFDTQRIRKTMMFGNELTLLLSKEQYSSLLRSELLDANKIDHETIIKKLTEKANHIGNRYFAKNVIAFIYYSILVLAMQITLFAINPWFGLLTFIALPLFYFITKQIYAMVEKREARSHQLDEDHMKSLRENVKQLKNIKLLNGVVTEEQRYNRLLTDVTTTERKHQTLLEINSGLISDFIIGLILVGVLGIGSWMVMQADGTATLGAIIASVAIIPRIYPAFRKMMDAQVFPSFIHDDIAEINEILELKPENRADTVQQLDEIYSLKFKDIYFDYGVNSKFNIENINFEIKKGEKLGIFGLSNSGKTTIADLITKIIRPRQGNVLINNCDLNKVNSYYLRELISIVPQNYKLFTGTIEHNITYPLAFDEYQYNEALNKCRLKSLLNGLEKKDQTIVSEDTKLLTPAEKQRIALANAIYKDAKIFILDDATAKLDQPSEMDIINEIIKLKNKITIILSNRIYTLMKCDKIMILNNGRVLEYGKTEDLLNDQKSTFAHMMKEQENSKSRVG